VLSAPGDNLWIHRAIYAARPGDILVVATSSSYERGYWGEIMTHAALHRHIGGLVIDGCVRDAERLRQLQLPIFARGLCIRGTTKNAEACGSIGLTITVGEVQVSVGDVIFGDEDGIVAIPHHVAPEVLAAAEERAKFETNVISALREGSRTIDIYNLPGSVAERTSDA
jgi:4-hydroxy-4-methyl-2-oxoglutarate aldolase